MASAWSAWMDWMIWKRLSSSAHSSSLVTRVVVCTLNVLPLT